ncbi:MAG: hypothetical protein N3C13_04905, partial [Aquificaceae bacterium]|nr:hypothetical protein [Aquificaceae bacterium]
MEVVLLPPCLISCWIYNYYLTLKGEGESLTKGGLVPLSEYQSLQEQIGRLLYRLCLLYTS